MNFPHQCGKCKKRWGGSNTAHCAGKCHQTFTGLTAFEKHRRNGDCQPAWKVGLVDAGRKYPCWGFPNDDHDWDVDVRLQL